MNIRSTLQLQTRVALLALLVPVGCDLHTTRDEFDRQLEYCTVAENNGILDSALEGCQAALAIAEAEEYEPELVGNLLYRLGRLQRQRSRFPEAESLQRRSLTIAEASDDPAAVALRQVELALSLAGQGRWTEGAELLERAAPVAPSLDESDRKTADGAFRLFAARLRSLGDTALAERLEAQREATN